MLVTARWSEETLAFQCLSRPDEVRRRCLSNACHGSMKWGDAVFPMLVTARWSEETLSFQCLSRLNEVRRHCLSNACHGPMKWGNAVFRLSWLDEVRRRCFSNACHDCDEVKGRWPRCLSNACHGCDHHKNQDSYSPPQEELANSCRQQLVGSADLKPRSQLFIDKITIMFFFLIEVTEKLWKHYKSAVSWTGCQIVAASSILQVSCLSNRMWDCCGASYLTSLSDSWTGSEIVAASPHTNFLPKVFIYCATDYSAVNISFLGQFWHLLNWVRLYWQFQYSSTVYSDFHFLRAVMTVSFNITLKIKIGHNWMNCTLWVASIFNHVPGKVTSLSQLAYWQTKHCFGTL